MKKLYFAAIAALMVASCSKQDAVQPAAQTFDQNPTTAAVTDLFSAEEIANNLPFYYNVSIDVDGLNLYSSYKNYFFKFNVNSREGVRYEIIDYNKDGEALKQCVDSDGNYYSSGNMNRLAKYTPDGQYRIDLTSKFPANTIFLRFAAADNGNVFVTTVNSADITDDHLDASNNYWWTKQYSFTKQQVWRISSTGNVALITNQLNSNGKVYSMGIDGWYNEPPFWDNNQYKFSINKPSGSVIYGLGTDKQLFKVGTVNGVIEYFTPRVPVEFIATAKDKTNPYALSGNTIVELRPTLAKDVVVGTIPSSIANKPIYAFLTNADATVFYVLTEGQTLYKLTLN